MGTQQQQPVTVWFVCKLCGSAYQLVTQFLDHKKDEHYDEFRNVKCVVFEERALNLNFIYGYATASTASQNRNWTDATDDLPVPIAPAPVPPYNLHVDGGSGSPSRQKPTASDHNKNMGPQNSRFTQQLPNEEINLDDDDDEFPPDLGEPYLLYPEQGITTTDTKIDVNTFNSSTNTEETDVESILLGPTSEVDGDGDADASDTDDPLEMEVDSQNVFRIDPKIPNPYRAFVRVERLSPKELRSASRFKRRQKLKKIKRNLNVELPIEQDKSSKLSDIDVDAGHKVVDLTEMSPQHTDPGQDPLDYQTNTATTDGTIRAETETAHLRTGTGTVPIEIVPEALNPYPVQCNLCPETFNSLPDFEAHLEACVMLTKQRHRHCIPCNKTFRDAYGLNRHNSSWHSTPTTAKSNFTSKSANFKCQLCPKEFLTALLLKYHTQTHRSTSDNKTFAKSIATSKRSHHKSVHSPAKRPLNAYSEDNLENTSSNNIRKRHRVFYCPFNCGQSFTKNYNVKRHIGRKHPGEFGEGPDLVETITIRDGVSDPFGSDEEIMEIEPETESRLEPGAPSMLQVILETGSRRKQVLERNPSPQSQYEPIFGPKSTTESNLETEPTVKPKSEIKPKLEPNSKTEMNSHTKTDSKPEPKSETETKPKIELTLEQDLKLEILPILESKPEPNSEPSQVATIDVPADSELPEKPAFTCLHPNCSENFDTVANLRHHLIHFHIANDIETASTPAFALSTPEPEPNPDPESSSLLSTSKEEDSDGPQRRKSLQSTNDSPFQCTIENCDKSFTRSDNLKRHIRRFHQLYDEAELQVMVTRTRDRGTIEMESRNRTSPAPFICPRMSCRKTFTRHDSLKRHMGRAHGSDEEIEVVTIDL